jgi:uncharacterized protein
MCKAPFAGTVKTRLTPFLTAEASASLATAFAQDAVQKCVDVKRFVAYAPKNGKDVLEKILPDGISWIEQSGDNLGERMHNAFAAVYQKNHSPLVMIGTDSPTLPPTYIKQAFDVLSNHRADVVLGATEDGGYYLIGLNKPNGEILADVEWSSPRTFAQTAQNIKNLDLKLETLPAWYDVDVPEDLLRLREEISTNKNAAKIAPHTAKWLQINEKLFE